MTKPEPDILAKLNLEIAPGLSSLGTKTLTINRKHGFEVHDTGGMGEARTLELDAPTPEQLQILPMACGQLLTGLVQFGDKVSATFEILESGEDIADAVWQLLPRSESEYDSKLPVCVTGSFATSINKIRAKLPKAYPHDVTQYQKLTVPKIAEKGTLSGWFQRNVTDGLRLHNWQHFYTTRLFEPRADLILCEVARHREFYLRVVVHQGRFKMIRGPHVLLDLSLEVLSWTRDENDQRVIKLHNQVTLASELVNGLTLYFSSSMLAEALIKCLGEPSVEPEDGKRLSDVVRLSGRLADRESVDEKVDVLLTDSELQFRSVTSGGKIVSLSFNDPTLRMAGTSDNFLLFNARVGPLVVSEGSAPFREQLNEHPKIRRAAQTSLKHGPYALDLNGSGVILRLSEEHLHLKSIDFDGEVMLRNIESLRSTYTSAGAASLEFQTPDTSFKFVGRPEQAEAFHTALLSRLIQKKETFQLEEVSRAILALEGDYFLYTIFSPFFHLDRLLHASGEQEHLNWLALISQGTANLLRHLEMICQFLPCFVASLDRKLGAQEAASLEVCKQQERELRRALHTISALTGDMYRIKSLVTSRTGLRESKADYGPLAISLVGASLFSPLCLLAGAQHAYGAATREEQQGKHNKQALLQTRTEVKSQWQFLLQEKLPLLSYHVIEDIFGVRIRLAKHISQRTVDPELKKALAERLARLKTLPLFPEDPAMNYNRAQIVDDIKRRRDSISYDGFTPF